MDTSEAGRLNTAPDLSTIGRVALLVLFGFAIFAGMYVADLPTPDLRQSFRPAVQRVFAGEALYGHNYFNPPWLLLPVVPLALIPERAATALWATLMLGLIAWTTWRYTQRLESVVIMVTSPVVLHVLLVGNLDWLVLAGAAIPGPVGILLLAGKPQIGVGLLAFRLLKHPTDVWLLVLMSAISVGLFGPWWQSWGRFSTASWNTAWWPLGLVVAAVLFVAALRRQDERFALAAGPFAAPYLLLHSWATALLALATDRFLMAAAWVGM